MHMTLASVVFGSCTDKIMIVPANRGAAWCLKFDDKEAGGQALAALRIAGCTVHGPPGHVPAPLNDVEMEQILHAPGFSAYLQGVEELLARLRMRTFADHTNECGHV